MAEETPKPKGKAGNAATKKYGPLKAWQWVGLIAGAGVVYIYIRNKQANTAATTSPAGATNATDASAPPLEQLGSGVDSGAGSTPLPGSDVFAQLLANQQATQAAENTKLQGENNRQKAAITALQKAVAKLTPAKTTAAKKVAAAKKAPVKAAAAKPVTKPKAKTTVTPNANAKALADARKYIGAPPPVPAKVAR